MHGSNILSISVSRNHFLKSVFQQLFLFSFYYFLVIWSWNKRIEQWEGSDFSLLSPSRVVIDTGCKGIGNYCYHTLICMTTSFLSVCVQSPSLCRQVSPGMLWELLENWLRGLGSKRPFKSCKNMWSLPFGKSVNGNWSCFSSVHPALKF